jgi:hypothetical protein
MAITQISGFPGLLCGYVLTVVTYHLIGTFGVMGYSIHSEGFYLIHADD